MIYDMTGNLITLANKGEFDVIAHGCNCFCTQRSGLAPQMVKAYGTDTFPMEGDKYKGLINKLGSINYKTFNIEGRELIVVNAYTQYDFRRSKNNEKGPADYEAIALVFRKMNNKFKGLRIGLPLIGCGLAGGDEATIRKIMINEFVDCDLTIVVYDGS